MSQKFEFSEIAFISCTSCSIHQNSIKDWMKHLLEFHPIPNIWMSDKNCGISRNCLAPYTAVTESRKKRRKNLAPRPLNSFMIFSRHLRRVVLMFFAEASNSEISKLLGKFWSTLKLDTKAKYNAEAKRLALLHAQEFPDYKYRPQKRRKFVTEKSINEQHSTNVSDELLTNPIDLIIENGQAIQSLDYNLVSSQLSSSGNVFMRNIGNHRKVIIPQMTPDDNDDVESSVSSSKLPSKMEITFQSISTMSKRLRFMNEKKVFSESDLSFTRPLSVITEGNEGREVYLATNIKSNRNLVRRSYMNINQPLLYRNESVKQCKFIECLKHETVNIKTEPLELSEKMINHISDPLITDDVCENDCFFGEYLSIDNEYHQCRDSSWVLQSPNYKLSTMSSNSSDNTCRDVYGGSPSPFSLSESDQNTKKKLPTIGSWLRPNYSEYTI